MAEAVATGSSARIDKAWLRVGAMGLIAALVADVLFNIDVKKGDNGGTGPMLGVGGILIVLALILYIAVFPRFANRAKASLVTGIVSVLLLAVFWSGAPMLIAAAAFGYGLSARSSTMARGGMGLAALAALVDLVAAILSA